MLITLAFGRVLRQLRQEAELTQEQLGMEAEIQRNYISSLELGGNQPSITSIFKLSHDEYQAEQADCSD